MKLWAWRSPWKESFLSDTMDGLEVSCWKCGAKLTVLEYKTRYRRIINRHFRNGDHPISLQI